MVIESHINNAAANCHPHHSTSRLQLLTAFSMASLLLSRKSTTAASFLFRKMSLSAVLSTLCTKSRNSPFAEPTCSPPSAKKVPFEVTAHGITWGDPYRWMSGVNDPDFVRYIDKENSYAEAFMRDTEEWQRILYSEMVARMPSKITTPPEHWGPWFYYQCIPEGKEYPVLCRKSALESEGWESTVLNGCGGGSGRSQVLLDWNEIAEEQGYVHVGSCRISPDHNFVAYTVDTTGHEQFQLRVKDLRTNTLFHQPRVDGVMSLAWAQDSRTLFYTLCDQNQRPYRVLCTTLGSYSRDDAIVLTEDDTRCCVDITSTKDGKFVTVNSNSRTSSEVYVINATKPQSGLQRFCKRTSGVQFFLEHHDRTFYVLTNAPTSKCRPDYGYYLAHCGDENVQSANLKTIIVPNEDIHFEDMDIFNGHLVLFLSKAGSPSVCSVNLPIRSYSDRENEMEIEGVNPWYFPVPSNMCTIAPGSNHDFLSTTYRVVLSSPVVPDLFVDYDMSRRTFSIVQQEDVKNIATGELRCNSSKFPNISYKKEIDADQDTSFSLKDFSERYACEEKEVTSFDGVRIPLTILFSRNAYKREQSPGLLHGYGAYGEALDRSWCPDRLSLLDRGWMFAFADVRGGAGTNPSWHKSGSRLKKLNSICDFISCGEYLINEGYIHRDQLAALGISAGSLLVGAAINMRPKLFRAAILKVPFLDVLNTLLDPSLPLTTLDYEEFGDPQTKSYFEYILKYSPYDNVPPGVCCPSMLVSASFNDSRVGVWDAAKWVAKIRDSACSRCTSSVILQTNKDGGHFGEGGRFAHCRETAYDYTFLMKVVTEEI